VFEATGSGWTCLTLPPQSLVAAPSCPSGGASRWDGTTWHCDSLAAEKYVCPAGYQQDAETAYLVCEKPVTGGMDEMVAVSPGGPPAFWIDRYEMSICSGSVGNPNGYNTTAVGCSVSGVQPTTGITWFQAEAMCLNAGKTLCTNAEWQTAVSGTNDPGPWPHTTGCSGTIPGAGDCNTCSGGTRVTGLGALSVGGNCVSVYGAEDMIGNVWEWVGDWLQSGPSFTSSDGNQVEPWGTGYGDGADATFNLDGTAYGSGAWGQGIPSGHGRGGGFNTGYNGGAFADSLYHSPAWPDSYTGARCCAGGRW
jgi:formylglycine-generating enzyme required for sulfatase activity